MHRLVMHFCVHNCKSSSNDYAAVACSNNHAGTVTHSRISSLLIYRRLTRPRFAFEVFSSDLYVPEVGVATPKISPALRTPVAKPPFLNF